MEIQNVTKFVWTALKEQAAYEVAEDKLTDEEIAENAGVRRNTLAVWKRHPEFAARVEQHVAAYRKRVMSRGIADRTRRLDRLNDSWKRMQQVIIERSVDPAMVKVPGGKTGLLCRQLKSVGFGENNQIVEEYAVDTGLLKELREHERHAAQELGQWTERHAVGSVPDGDGELKPLVIEVVDTDAKLSRESQSPGDTGKPNRDTDTAVRPAE